MNNLDQKINTHFAGLVVRKDLVKTVKGNAIVPTYVLICWVNIARQVMKLRFKPA